MGVLDHDEEGAGLGGGLEKRVHGLEQLAAGQGGVVAGGVAAHPAACPETAESGVQLEGGGDHVGGVGSQPAEDLGEREVGKRAVGEVEAVARGDLPAVLERAIAELGEQAGLAEAGVTAEEDDRVGAVGGARPRGRPMPSRATSSPSSASRPTRSGQRRDGTGPIIAPAADTAT